MRSSFHIKRKKKTTSQEKVLRFSPFAFLTENKIVQGCLFFFKDVLIKRLFTKVQAKGIEQPPR